MFSWYCRLSIYRVPVWYDIVHSTTTTTLKLQSDLSWLKKISCSLPGIKLCLSRVRWKKMTATYRKRTADSSVLYQDSITFSLFLSGSCHGAADGLYYVDENNFAFCSNGIKSIQKCAEGSANRPLEYFHPGNHYSYVDFCSVNLSDFDKAH